MKKNIVIDLQQYTQEKHVETVHVHEILLIKFNASHVVLY